MLNLLCFEFQRGSSILALVQISLMPKLARLKLRFLVSYKVHERYRDVDVVHQRIHVGNGLSILLAHLPSSTLLSYVRSALLYFQCDEQSSAHRMSHKFSSLGLKKHKGLGIPFELSYGNPNLPYD